MVVWIPGRLPTVGDVSDVLDDALQQPRPGITRAGRTIGLLERTLVFAAILLRLEALVTRSKPQLGFFLYS